MARSPSWRRARGGARRIGPDSHAVIAARPAGRRAGHRDQRAEADIDGFLAPLRLPLASEHGAQYRLFDTSVPATAPPALEPVLQAAQAWPRATPACWWRPNA